MKMYLEIILLIIIIVILGYLLFYSADILFSPTTPQSTGNTVCFSSNCFIVELAKTNAERENGLMNRKELDRDKGMLFIFDNEGIYPFWMKNTLIPLDMIWLDDNSRVVFISQNVQPCKSLICPIVIPSAKAKYVLEINADVTKNLGIKMGDVAKLNIE